MPNPSDSPATTHDTIHTPTAAEVHAARLDLLAEVAELQKQDVAPRQIDILQLTAAFSRIAERVARHQEAFSEEEVTPALVLAAAALCAELKTKVEALPADFRSLRRTPQQLAELLDEAHDLLARYTRSLDRRVRGPAMRKAAHDLGLGVLRGRSIQTLEVNYRDALHAAQDEGLLKKAKVSPAKIATLKAMHARLLAALPAKKGRLDDLQSQIDQVDQLQLAVEVFYQRVGAAAEWALDGDERLQLVKLLPRTEVGRKGKAATATPESEPAEEPEPTAPVG